MTDVRQGRPAASPPDSPPSPRPFTYQLVDALVYRLKGLCIALDQHTDLSSRIDPDQAAQWVKELDSASVSLRRFSRKLKESAHDR